MKKITGLLSAITILAGCDFDTGERTVFWDEDKTSSIERTITGSSDGSQTIASCVAVPTTWDDEIIVSATGSYQVNGETQILEVTPALYPEGLTKLAELYGLADHTWHCYSDIARDYLSTDTGKIKFTLIPQSDNAMVYTTVGVISDERRSDHYYGNLVGHQILTSDTVDAHWVKGESAIDLDNMSTVELADSTIIYSSSDYQKLSEETSPLYRFDETGFNKISDLPQTDSLYQVNGLYISHKSYEATIDDNTQDWTDIRFSTDLITWSDAVTLPNIAQVQWDPRGQQYIAFTNDYNPPTENNTYVSTNLVTWTKEQWVSFQSPNVAFLADGTAIIETSSRSQPYWIRDADSDQWSPIDITPVAGYEGYVGTIYFGAQNVWTSNNRLFTTAIRQLTAEGDSGWDNENIVFGYSDNGTDWTWTDLGLYDEIASDYDIKHVGDNTIIYSTSKILLVSDDNGATWQNKTKPSILLSTDKDLEVYSISGRIDKLHLIGDEFIGRAYAYNGAPSSTTILFKTRDFENYQLFAVTGWIKLLISETTTQFLESGADGVFMQTLTAAASDNDGDYLSDALDSDDDNDGVSDEEDAFPLDAAETVDTDEDGIGNNADTDDDGDGVLDADDAFSLDASESKDSDNDGTGDNSDLTPNGPIVEVVNDSSGGALHYSILFLMLVLSRFRKSPRL